MSGARDPCWYREEAKQLRLKAAAVKRDEELLRDTYLSLAREYERLADLLENRSR